METKKTRYELVRFQTTTGERINPPVEILHSQSQAEIALERLLNGLTEIDHKNKISYRIEKSKRQYS